MNPELRRNLWLEISPTRLVAMPVVLALVIGFVAAQADKPWLIAFPTAVFLFMLLVHFWGMRGAAESVTEEVRDRTWDWQRLSSLRPWEMAWGKLAGATAYAWYGGAVCLVVMGVAAAMERGIRSAGWVALALVGSGVALHGVALASSLQAARKSSKLGARMGTLLLIPIAIGLAVVFTRQVSVPQFHPWYGMRVELPVLIALSSVAAAAWAVLAAHREMSRELRVHTLPWALPAFTLFIAAYAAGFAPPGNARAVFLQSGLATAAVLTYFGIFADVTNAMSLRRLAALARGSRWRRLAEELPSWAIAWVMALLFALAATLQGAPDASPAAPALLRQLPAAVTLHALRDIGILLFFALSPRARRIEAATLLWILLLSWILPGVLNAAGLPMAAEALMPFAHRGAGPYALMALHVALAWGAAAWRWRALERSFGTA